MVHAGMEDVVYKDGGEEWIEENFVLDQRDQATEEVTVQREFGEGLVSQPTCVL